MRFLQHVVAAVSLCFVASVASASPAAPVNGADYRTLDKPQQTDSGKKIEVIEFFWYSCPHCHAFDPALSEWVKKQGDNIVFKRVPIAFRDTFVPQQKLYYALEAMGKLEELHPKIFRSIHVERKALDSDKAILEFVGNNGIDKQKFADLYNSFGVQTKVRRASQLQEGHNVDGVPLIAIDGRYMTSPSIVGASLGNQPETVLQNGTLQVMDHLLLKASKERKSAAVEPKAAPAVKLAATEGSKKQ